MLLLMSAAHLQVNQSAGAVDLVNVTMSGVFGSPMTDVAHVRLRQSTGSLQYFAVSEVKTASASITSASRPSWNPSGPSGAQARSISKCQLWRRAFGLAGYQPVDLSAVQVFSNVLCNSSCTEASGNRFAATFSRENLTLSTAHLLSVKPDGTITLTRSCHGTLLLIGAAPAHLADSSRE